MGSASSTFGAAMTAAGRTRTLPISCAPRAAFAEITSPEMMTSGGTVSTKILMPWSIVGSAELRINSNRSDADLLHTDAVATSPTPRYSYEYVLVHAVEIEITVVTATTRLRRTSDRSMCTPYINVCPRIVGDPQGSRIHPQQKATAPTVLKPQAPSFR